MAEAHETSLVSEDRLDLSLIAPKNRTLVLEVGQPRVAREFLIRGRLDVDRMVVYMQLETQINEALATEGPTAEQAVIAALDFANSEVRGLLLDLNPAESVPEKLGLDEQQTLILLAWISGDVTVADAIARVLTAGMPAKTAGELEADAEADAVEHGVSDVSSAAPLPSR